jgi:hypothetical protein
LTAEAIAWEARAEAARNGVFLFDNAGQRSSEFLGSPQIRALYDKASVLGLVAYEEPLRSAGERF